MSVPVLRSAAVLLGALVLGPFAHAIPAGGEEDNCVHLLGYAGTTQQSGPPQAQPAKRAIRRPANGGGGPAVGICAVDNARLNGPSPIKTNADFVPVTGDDSLGLYCVYGVHASATGGIAGNVCIYLIELTGGEVLVYGSGYGNIPGANYFDAAYDMERVDQVIRFCMGKIPAQTPLRMLAPHGHGDHINPACNRELERLGYKIVEITFHQGDNAAISGMAWTTADRALFRVLPASTTCLQELARYDSPLGKLWVFDRPGHTPGSIDLVIDVQNDPTNRFVVRGSQPSTPCAPLPGQREIINAHGNVELLTTPPTLVDLAPLSGTSLGGTPLTLTGVNFSASGAGTPRVLLSGAPATEVVVLSDTSLTCKTPAGPPGQLVDVVVVTNNGQSALAGSYYYNMLPTVTSLTPQGGDWRGGTAVQVRGTGFQLTAGINEVWFGTRKATSVVVKSDTLLTCRTPVGTPGSVVSVEVRNPNGTGVLPNAYRYNADVSITSATPSSSTALGGTTVVLAGTSFTGSGATPTVTVGGAPATGVTLISDTSVSFVTPVGTPGALVDIVLTNSTGSATFSGFRYHASPTLIALTPASGPSTGGTSILLAGSGFVVDSAGPNQVRFGGVPASVISVVNDGVLTCRAPSGIVGTIVNVTITNANGTATLPLAYAYLSPLTASALTPNSGSAQGGTPVTITGTGFVAGPAGASSVLFGGVPATLVSATDDGTLTCLAPAGTPQAVVDVQITNANGTVTMPAAFRYHALPVLASLSPNNGHAGSPTTVTLSGTGFLNDRAGFDLVVVGGVAASNVDVRSDTQIVCVFPTGVPGSTVDVIVANENGTSSLPNSFRYHTAPTLTSLAPASSPASAQARITLTGTGFLNDQAGTLVITFGGVPASAVSVVSDTSALCNAPVGTPGRTVDVVLQNARGSAALPNGFRFHARPTVTSVTPNRGTFQGGTAVTLNGTGFVVDGAGTNAVTFGGLPAANVVTLNDTTLRCTTPPGAQNAVVDVVLTNTNGSATLVRGFSYSVPPPAVVAVTPASGPANAPGSVVLTGSGFVNDSAGTNTVKFGVVASGIVGVLDDTRLTCQVPPGTPGSSVDVVVSNANGTGTLALGFRYHRLPVLTSLAPTSAAAQGGATVQLTGSGFAVDSPGTNLVTFGGVAATNVVVLNDTTLSCVVPPGTPGASVPVLVSNDNGQSGARSFAYHALPGLTAVTPNFGAASGGTTVTVTGSGFQSNNPGPLTLTFGGRSAASVLVVSDTTLLCVTPRGGPGYVDVALTSSNGVALLPNGFHFGRLPPEITAIAPADGPSRGQNVVTLKGRGFQSSNAGENRVKFGTVLATNVITLDDETVLCSAPAGVPGTTVDVALNNNAGTATVVQAYRYHVQPTLTAVSPDEGRAPLALRLKLTGSGFLLDSPGSTVVLLDNLRARDVVVLDDNRIACTALGGSPGALIDVTVRNDNGSATLVDAIRVLDGPPGILSVTPSSGPYVGGTTVALVGTGFDAGGVRVSFGTVQATGVVVLDDTHLECVTPPGTLGQSVTVEVRTKNGTAAMIGGYRYTAIVPVLTSLAPDHGPAAGGTRVTLTGTGFTAPNAGVTRVRFGGAAAQNVTVLDDRTVACDSPAGTPAAVVDVELENAFGLTRLVRSFRYHARPSLTSLAPANGRAEGGTRVTLLGTGFAVDAPGPNQVRFGGVLALDVAVVSDQELACTAPAGSAGATVDVSLSNRNGTATLSAAFRYIEGPVLTNLTPPRGPIEGGTPLTLTGRGFQANAAGPNVVTLDGVSALAVTVLDDATLTCVTPPGTKGSADVVVTNANGSATAAGGFEYFVAPTLSALSPDRGSAAGGTRVTLTGTGFLEVTPGTNLVLFGGVAATDVTELSDTRLVCTAPPGSTGARVDVSLANENGFATLPSAFQYHGAPALAGVTPNHGRAAGVPVTLTGSGFLNDQAGTNTVTFGGAPATQVVVIDDAMLTCRAPVGTPGAVVDVVLTNDNGSGTLPSAFRYHAEPTLTNVVPTRGPAAGGTSVTLTGSGFLNDQPGLTNVLFSGFVASAVLVLSDTTLTCTSPAGFPNTLVSVTVVNDNGSATRANAFRYNPLPSLTSVAPTNGSAQGGTLVTLTGSAFGLNNPGVNTVFFGAAPATSVTLVNDSTLTCLAPAGTPGATVDVSVSNANGAATLAAAYRFNAVPVLTAVAPASAPSPGGVQVTLAGSGFADPHAGFTLVTFGGTAAGNVSVLDDARVQCTLPAGAPGSVVDVVLANANGQTALPAGFRYHAQPTLTAILPARGSSAASSTLTLLGSGFLADSPGPNTVRFGAMTATNVVVLGDTSLTCDVAPQAAGTVVDVTLSNANGSAALLASFAFDAPAPTLLGLAPASGASTGGTLVTLTGTGFLAFSAGPNTVTFGGAFAAGVTVVDDATLKCQTPPGTIGATVDVAVANVNGSALLAGAFTYVAPAPTLASLAPASGPAVGGGTVTLTGSGFLANNAGANTVSFGGSAASNVNVLSDTSLACSVPAGPAGGSVTVVVTNANGSAQLADGYRYHATPTLNTLSPVDGTALGGTLVAVRGSGFLADGAGTNTILFGANPATSVTVADDTRLTCRAPSGSPGAIVNVSLSNQNGSAQLASAYRYHARPTLTGVSPASGPAAGGNRVTLTGTGFVADGAIVNIVAFGGITATGVTVLNDQTIQCNVPAGTSGLSVQVTVANVNGTALLANGYRYHARPTLTGVSPSKGDPAGGTLVTLTGSGFQVDNPGPSSVTFGGAAATAVNVLSDTQLTCQTPPGTTGATVDVVLSNANGSATRFAAYTYDATTAPVVTGVLPNKGTTQGSTPVTVTGTGFAPGMTVSFGANAAPGVVVVDASTITCLTPPSAGALWVDVSVQHAGGTATLPLAFQFVAPPTLTDVEPSFGEPQGGALVVLTGSGFLDDAPGTNLVTFGGRAATDVNVLDDAHLSCLAPDGPALTSDDVVVSNDNGTARLPQGFRWQMRLATDINNDGRGDLVLASPGNDAISADAGAVHVFFGTPLPVPDMSSAQAELTALPAVAGTTFGAPVVSGDLDGDGQAELVIGAPGDDQLARDGGAVFVFGGPLGPSPAALQPAQARQTFASARQNDRLGKAIVLHDLDRNGFLDLLIGAPGRAPGTVFVYLGGPGGPDTQADLVINGEVGNEAFASSLAAGDLDGDGWSEVLVGAQNAFGDLAQSPTGNNWHPGEVRVYQGGPALLSASDPQPWLIFSGDQDLERFGATLAARDLDGDGIGDLAVGAPGRKEVGNQSGALLVFFGRAGLTGASSTAAQLLFSPEAPGDLLGSALSVGDVDDDGRADLLVGAPGYAGIGRAYLLLGSTQLASRAVASAEAIFQAEGGTPGAFGSTVALVDVDGNGLEEPVVTAPAFSGELGRVYVFDGTAVLGGRTAAGSDGKLTGVNGGDRLGAAASSDQ